MILTQGLHTLKSGPGSDVELDQASETEIEFSTPRPNSWAYDRNQYRNFVIQIKVETKIMAPGSHPNVWSPGRKQSLKAVGTET